MPLVSKIPEGYKTPIGKYVRILLAENQRINLISRRLGEKEIWRLIGETFMMMPLIRESVVVDAGSGGGILAVPIAIANPDKRVFAIETRKKKTVALVKIAKELALNNLTVYDGPIRQWTHHHREERCSLVARGFPRISELVVLLQRPVVSQLVLISSREKINKIVVPLESITQTIYNIPCRDHLVAVQMENVSRETSTEKR